MNNALKNLWHYSSELHPARVNFSLNKSLLSVTAIHIHIPSTIKEQIPLSTAKTVFLPPEGVQASWEPKLLSYNAESTPNLLKRKERKHERGQEK